MTARSRRFWATTGQQVIAVDDPRTVNLDQAVRIAGRTRRTLYYWMRDGVLPFVQIKPGHRRMTRGDLLLARQYSEHGRPRTWAESPEGTR
jgi:hypothetical protein